MNFKEKMKKEGFGEKRWRKNTNRRKIMATLT
jgi:DNA-binding PadR family transcriptional regulator